MSKTYQRIYARFPLESSAEISTKKAKGISGILTDISAGGAGLVTDIPFDPAEKVELLIKSCFLFKNALSKKAKVVWCKSFGNQLWQVGLDFGINTIDFYQ